jgi:hypothetical protein
MKYSLSFLPEVEYDVIAGFSWYEEKAAGLGGELLRSFYACSSEIPRNPLLYRMVYKDFRRRLLRRFPFAVYFKIIETSVVIVGLFHCARDPRLINDELIERKT